jgi:pectate lyase
MKKQILSVLCGALWAMQAGAAEKPALPVFPGAEGWGTDTPGGRGGKVITVTNLNPDGPGSLQEACATPGPRIVVFAVSGVISNLITIEHSNITIAGQTAPGAGITIAGQLATKEGISDVVIRHLRVRPLKVADSFAGPEGERRARRLHECGKANPLQGEFDPAALQTMPAEFHDGAALNGVERLVLDHFTVSWAADESLSVCRSRYVTVQWSSIEAGTIKEGTKYSGYHNFGMFSAYNATGDFISVHHNLFAHNSRRTPSVRDGQADLRNNVVYNARGGFDHDGGCSATGTPHDYNYIGNYFKRGPNSRGALPGVSWGNRFWWAEFRNETRADRGKSFYFVEDNLWDDQPPPLPPYVEDGTVRLKEPMPAPKVTTQKAKEAYELVLARAGAWPRDAVTKLTIEEVRAGTGDYGRREPKGGLLEGLTPGAAPLDTDKDGMPDEWEKKNGLDPAKDDSAKVMPTGYTAVEVYLNELAEALAPAVAVAAPISDAAPVPARPAVAPVTAAPPPAVPATKAALVGTAPDYMGNVPGRANVLVIGGDMVERNFGWSHYLGLLHPEWNTERLTARGWRVDQAVAGFDEALAACAPADGVLLNFGEAECAAAYAKEQTPAQFAEQLKQLVAKIRGHEKTKEAALAMVTPFPVVAEWMEERTAATYGAGAAQRCQALAEAVRQVGAELAGTRSDEALRNGWFLHFNGYDLAHHGAAQCAGRLNQTLAQNFPVKHRADVAGQKFAAYEAQLAELSRILAETSAGTVRSRSRGGPGAEPEDDQSPQGRAANQGPGRRVRGPALADVRCPRSRGRLHAGLHDQVRPAR